MKIIRSIQSAKAELGSQDYIKHPDYQFFQNLYIAELAIYS